MSEVKATEKRSLFSRMLTWIQWIFIFLIVLGFVGCCYMLDKFRWTL